MEGTAPAPTPSSAGQASAPMAPSTPTQPSATSPQTPGRSAGYGQQGQAGGQTPRAPGAPVHAGQAQPQQGQPQAQTGQPEKKYRRTIDGQPVELSRSEAIDAVFGSLGDDEVLDLASLRRGAYARMEEAAKLRKENEEFKKRLTGSERAFSEWFDLQPDKDAALSQLEQEMTKRYQESMATPEQKRMREYERKLQDMERKERTRVEAEQNTKREAYRAKFQQEFTTQVKEAAASMGFQGKDVPPIVLQSFALHAEQQLKAGQRVDVQQIARVVQREMREHINAYMGGLQDDALDTLMGDRFDRVAALRAARVQSPTPGAPISGPKRGVNVVTPRQRTQESLEGLSLEERFRRLEGR